MATTYLSPGVYVEEINSGVKPIQAVGASTAAFVGITAEACTKVLNDVNEYVPDESVINKSTLVTSWGQYTRIFGGFTSDAYMPDAIYGYFMNGGGPCYVTSVRAVRAVHPDNKIDADSASVAVPAASGKGTSFKVVSAVAGSAGNNMTVTITAEKDDKGEATGNYTVTTGSETQAFSMKKGDTYIGSLSFDGINIEDAGTAAPAEGTFQLSGGGVPVLGPGAFVGDAALRTGINGLEAIEDARLLICPDVMVGYDGSDEAKERVKIVHTAMKDFCEKVRYCFAVLDTPPGLNAQQAKEWKEYLGIDSSHAALYYPWIKVQDQDMDSPANSRFVPPSGHMIGIYNRVDAERGVHKAPANETIRGAIDLELAITRGEQDVLNPIGVNCIRTFTGRGIRVWGARTLSSDGSWRYINVRRLFILIEASMDAGLQWVVFEPNDQDLWARVRRDVSAFLRMIWRSGALFGASEDQAFYVKCDEDINPSELRDLGQLIIEVGVCPVKPAEFVIFRISQWAGANAE